MRPSVYLLYLPALLAIYACLSVGMEVNIPGRCPNFCSTDVESTFLKCKEKTRMGCALRRCDSPRRAVKCSLKSGVPDVVFTGERVTLRRFMVSRTFTTRIGIRGLSPKTDVYFLVDGTGSMGGAITSFRRSFLRLAEDLNENGDFAFGVGLFRDERQLEMGFRNLQAISTNVTRVREAVQLLRSRGGGDTPEANLVALYKIATGDFVRWREGAARVVLLFGDAVGHEPTCFDDVVLNRRVVTRALNEADITVQIVGTQFSSLNDRPTQFRCGRGARAAGTGQSDFIAARTGGSVNILDSGTPAAVREGMSDALANGTTIVDLAESTCDDGLTGTFDPPLPRRLRARRRIRTSFRLRRMVCARAPFECSLSFRAGGMVSDPLTIRIINPAGCPS